MMLGILCGLEQEAQIARQVEGVIVACAAARPHKARDMAQELVAKGATRLMSFGIAGSLETSVHLGDVFIGNRIASKTGQWLCDESWGRALADKIPHAKLGGVYGSETLVATIADKDQLFRGTGCAIVDMESQCVAEVASSNKLPFTVVRAVCDDSLMNVPPIVMASIAEDGTINVPGAIGHIIRYPWQIADLFRVMRGTGQALKALDRLKTFLH
jgi:adenosylhomocysteine nucleosidase